jgi:uncharacterized iron-regulated membrane protein
VHDLLGIMTMLWALVVGMTGVINTLANPIFSYWQSTELAEMIAPWRGKPAPSTVISVQKAIDAAQAAVPAMELRSVGFPGTSNAGQHHYVVFMKGKTALTEKLLTPVLIDAQTGALTDMREMPWYVTAFRLSQPLHFGDYGGLPLKMVWALLDLVTIVVLASGLSVWLTRWRSPIEQQMPEEAVLDDHNPVPTSAGTNS